MKTTVTIKRMQDCIEMTNDRGDKWTFTKDMTACNAMVLLLSESLQFHYDRAECTNDTFTMELIIQSNDEQ